MTITILTLFPALTGCIEQPDPSYEYGIPIGLGDLELEIVHPDVGVYPNTDILFDPNNPFRDGIAADGPIRFDVLGAGPIAGFYAFGTALAIVPFGENQWYTARQLHTIYDDELADPEQLPVVRDLAIRGYQQVLDEFPDTAFTFDPTGRAVFDLLVLSLEGILDLGGVPQNGWRLAVGPNGETIAVQSGG